MYKLIAIAAVSLIGIIFSISSVSDELYVRLVYRGFQFNIPSGMDAIGSSAGEGNFLAFRYGIEPGRKYIAFTDITEDQSIDYGCQTIRFYQELFASELVQDPACDEELVTLFRQEFQIGEHGSHFNRGELSVFATKADDKVFVFLAKNGTMIKVDSDFLSKEKLIQIIRLSPEDE